MPGLSVKRVRRIARREAKDVLEDEAEHKYYDVAINQAVLNAPATFQLTQIGGGTTQTTRLGLQIRPLYVTCSFLCYQNVAATAGNFLRIVLVLDTQMNGVTPSFSGAATSVMASPSTGIMMLRNPLMTNRYVILVDKVIALMPNGNNLKKVKFTRKLRCVTHYTTASSVASTDFAANQVYAFFISDQAANGPTVYGDMRLRFIDA